MHHIIIIFDVGSSNRWCKYGIAQVDYQAGEQYIVTTFLNIEVAI